MSHHGVIYLITNTVNRKQYVGQTISHNPLRYYRQHLSRARNGSGNLLIHRAIRKHGEDNFTFEVIWWANNQISLNISEDSFIQLFDTISPNGYNLRGGGARGKLSEVGKKNLSAAMALILVDPKVRARISIGVIAAHARPDVKTRVRLSQKEVSSRPGINERRGNSISVARATPETQAKYVATYLEFGGALAGRRWINDGEGNRCIMNTDPLPSGWSYGTLNYGGGDPTARSHSQSIGRHNRWHVRRGIKSPDCALCNEDPTVQEP